MATFSFNNSKPEVKKPVNKKVKVELIKHDAVEAKDECYTYKDSEGNDKKFSGIIIKDNDSYLGKVINTNKVILTYHPEVEEVEAQEEYFSYIDDEGKEKVFSGTPEFDLESNSYFGYIKETSYYEEVIDLFKEN